MRIRPLAVLLLFLSGVLPVAAQKKVSVPFQSILIDGDLSEWNAIAALTPEGSPIVVKAARDSMFLYLYLWFSDRRSFQDALQYGCTVYAEGLKAPKRSFGLTIPTGLVNELAFIPGARRKYLTDPMWVADAGNRRLLEQIDSEMAGRALITYRKTKDEKAARWPLPLVQLAAMDVVVRADAAVPTATEWKIPLQTSRVRQFGVDVPWQAPFRLGVEIQPPPVEEVMQDDVGMNPQMGGMDRVGRNAAGPNQRAMMMGQDQQLQNRQMMMLRMGAFSKWFVIKPPVR